MKKTVFILLIAIVFAVDLTKKKLANHKSLDKPKQSDKQTPKQDTTST